MNYLTVKEVSKKLNIGISTIYHNGPAKYGGIKIGGSWRFPEDKIGLPFEPEKKINTGYMRRFGKKKAG
ncbi:MAG TPA: helix-turn-helix domain-containing protein [Peptococcaceae bacterium]|nr:helix-turn-helix domain-containing protein [Peptococcaceae bacterium]